MSKTKKKRTSADRKRDRKITLYHQQHGRCYWCGARMKLDFQNNPESATFEHLNPRSIGGTMAKDNIALAHRSCNYLRGSDDVDEFGMLLDIIRAKEAVA